MSSVRLAALIRGLLAGEVYVAFDAQERLALKLADRLIALSHRGSYVHAGGPREGGVMFGPTETQPDGSSRTEVLLPSFVHRRRSILLSERLIDELSGVELISVDVRLECKHAAVCVPKMGCDLTR